MPTRARRPVTTAKPAVKVSAVKHFGPTRDVEKAPVIPFSIGFVRDGVEEVHEFAARPRVSYGDTIGLARADEDDMRALKTLDRSLRRMLLDDDGTPANWSPTITGKTFVDPDGDTRPVADLPAVKAFELGSSRRRWGILLDDPDPSLSVEVDQVLGIFEYITGQAVEHANANAS